MPKLAVRPWRKNNQVVTSIVGGGRAVTVKLVGPHGTTGFRAGPKKVHCRLAGFWPLQPKARKRGISFGLPGGAVFTANPRALRP